MTPLLILLGSLLAQAPSPSAPNGPSTYVVGPGDKIHVFVLDLPELDRSVTIDSRGNVNLPTVGSVHVAGLTPDQVEVALETSLKRILLHPDASVSVEETRSQPVSVLGAVKNPGVLQLQGEKTLIEVLSMAGGLAPDAGYQVRITRKKSWGSIPLPDATDDPTAQYSTAAVRVDDLMAGVRPTENIPIKPEDVISVPKGKVIYVIGGVLKPGGFVLSEQETISAVRMLALALGLDKTASAKNSKIIRPKPGTTEREEIAVNLSRILENKDPDVLLQADDILFVPTSTLKTVGYSALNSVGNQAGFAMYRIP
jgi:polysaccharide export outer membrane protein